MTSSIVAMDYPILNELLTCTPTEEILTYSEGRGQIRRLTVPLDYGLETLAPLPLFQRLNADAAWRILRGGAVAQFHGRLLPFTA